MINKLRLLSGIVLFIYVTLHLINHAAGIWSLQAMDAANRVLHWPWHQLPGQIVLYSAFIIHLALAFYALYQRRRLRMRVGEAAQLALGLIIPLLLIGHMIGTRGIHQMYATDVNYNLLMLTFWHSNFAVGLKQIALLFAAWIHGCIGIYYWLRLKPWFSRYQPYLYALSLLIPTLSLMGFIQSGKEVELLAQDSAWISQLLAQANVPDQAALEYLGTLNNTSILVFLALLLMTLVLRFMRLRWEQSRNLVQLDYDNGASTRFPPGRSLLEASRDAGIPHASICGGRGRCSTCRVRIIRGKEFLPEASESEKTVLARINAKAYVRLACQARPTGGEISIVRILPPGQETIKDGFVKQDFLQGQELEIAVLFADLRSFTQLSEKKLPYDVVFLLNQYFHSMGVAIEQAGGQIDKFIGDGIMALFGIETGAEKGSRSALLAAQQMGLNLEQLNEVLDDDLDSPLRIGIGIHTGPVIVGEMGYAKAKSITAIGDTVNTASRLEALSKNFSAELIVSQSTADAAKFDLAAFEQQKTSIRGRSEEMDIRVIHRARDLGLSEY